MVTSPVEVSVLVLLALNDFVFKGSRLIPAVIAGKLSDFAGLFAFSILIFSLAELIGRRLLGWRISALISAVVAAVFSLAKLSSPVAGWLGTLWTWALTPATLLVRGHSARPVHLAHDPTDIVALAACALVPYFVARANRASHT